MNGTYAEVRQGPRAHNAGKSIHVVISPDEGREKYGTCFRVTCASHSLEPHFLRELMPPAHGKVKLDTPSLAVDVPNLPKQKPVTDQRQ
jgi:hypothetical protein